MGYFMGYTHYLEFKAPAKGQAKQTETAYRRALIDCARIAKAWNAECKANGMSYARLSGYTAHCKLGEYGGLQLNGKADEACEPLELREHFKQNDSIFIKTNRHYYDTVVVACLAVLKHRLGSVIHVTTDGIADDMQAGLELARRVTKLKVKSDFAVSLRKVA